MQNACIIPCFRHNSILFHICFCYNRRMDALRVLIIDDNLQYAEELGRHFAGESLFELLPIITVSENAITAFKEMKPDLVVLDMIMPRIDGMEILRAVNARESLKDVMIFASTPFYMDAPIIQQAIDLGVTYFFYKPIDAEAVYSRILDTVNVRKKLAVKKPASKQEIDYKVESWIVNYLRSLGVSAHLKGYEYIKCAIVYCIDHGGRIPAISTELFPYVAEKYNTNWKSVDRNIRTAIEYAWNHGNVEVQHKLFGYTVNGHSGSPTCKEFIAMICERIVIRLKQM